MSSSLEPLGQPLVSPESFKLLMKGTGKLQGLTSCWLWNPWESEQRNCPGFS